MNEKQVEELVLLIVSEMDAEPLREYNRIRLHSEKGAMKWETVIVCYEGQASVYGRMPRVWEERLSALEFCNSVNQKVLYGTMFLQKDMHTVYKTKADLRDPYGSAQRLREALGYNRDVIAHYWDCADLT